MNRLGTFLLLSLPLVIADARAAGFIDHVGGDPYRWRPPGASVSYKVDPGAVSSGITNGEGVTLVANAFAVWDGVAVASPPQFQYGGLFPTDIDGTNYQNYVTFDEYGVPNLTGSESIIMFDRDGGIMNDLFSGQGNFVLGLGSPGGYDESTRTITKGFAIFNGAAIGVSTNTLRGTMTHEFGHIMNLAHTQLNWQATDEYVFPTMFPFLPDSPLLLTSLERDDEFSLAYLYPNGATYPAMGGISGKIRRRSGEGVLGVNVYCRNLSSPWVNAVSWVSDSTYEGNGEYVCGNLGTDSYSVEIEPIATAINLYDPFPPLIPTEFYSGVTEDFDPAVDPRGSSSAVAVVAGTSTGGIDIVLNEDGRLVSGRTATGVFKDYPWLGKVYSDLDYFIRVPAGASKVEFELAAADGSSDLDLFGRCDGEFSLTGDPNVGTSDPIYTFIEGSSQQAEFAADGSSGFESIELNGSSSPSLRACTYHLLVVNNSPWDTSFQLRATISGADPKFSVLLGKGDVVSDGTGETLVMSRKLQARSDTFRLASLSVTDLGIGDLSRVERATLYADSDGNSEVSSGDRILGTVTDIDRAARRMTFAGLNEYVEEGTPQTVLLTYTVTGNAGGGWPWVLLMSGVLAGYSSRRRRFAGLFLVFTLSTLGWSCGDSPKMFEPTVASRADVVVVGETFGDAFAVSIQDPHPGSVKEFFE